MSIAAKYRPYYTYEDYLLWDGRWELIGGIPYAMSPAPTPRHQRIAAELIYKFVAALKGCKKCKVYDPIDWKVAEDTVVQPDVSVFCKPIDSKPFFDFAPAIAIEILSPSTASKDRREKFEIYQSEGVKYYVLIDPAFQKVEIFELIDAIYQPVSINPVAFDFFIDECTASIDFADLFEE